MSDQDVLHRVRRALGRTAAAPGDPPTPPAIDPHIVRVIQRDANLSEIFAHAAKDQKMLVSRPPRDGVAAAIVEFLSAHSIRRVATSVSERLDRLGVFAAIQSAGLDVRRWDQLSLDQAYEVDCAVTDVHFAVAENATLVIKPTAQHGRGLSLVPMFHIAVVEASQIIPDMLDLFEHLRHDSNRSNVILITGPSKTADIEMNVVTGVHGPNVVQIFLV